jgi:hypothetical protein
MRVAERTKFTEFGPDSRDDAGHVKCLTHPTAVQALFVAWYNFSRKHEALKGQTPAMASKLTDHIWIWTIKERIERAAAFDFVNCESHGRRGLAKPVARRDFGIPVVLKS